jgi:hypothetical protein
LLSTPIGTPRPPVPSSSQTPQNPPSSVSRTQPHRNPNLDGSPDVP